MAAVDPAAGIERIRARLKAREAAEKVAQELKDQQREMLRSDLRAQMPEVAQVVDSVRSVFGDCKVLIAEEGGRRVSVSAEKLKSLGLHDE